MPQDSAGTRIFEVGFWPAFRDSNLEFMGFEVYVEFRCSGFRLSRGGAKLHNDKHLISLDCQLLPLDSEETHKLATERPPPAGDPPQNQGLGFRV